MRVIINRIDEKDKSCRQVLIVLANDHDGDHNFLLMTENEKGIIHLNKNELWDLYMAIKMMLEI